MSSPFVYWNICAVRADATTVTQTSILGTWKDAARHAVAWATDPEWYNVGPLTYVFIAPAESRYAQTQPQMYTIAELMRELENASAADYVA